MVGLVFLLCLTSYSCNNSCCVQGTKIIVCDTKLSVFSHPYIHPSICVSMLFILLSMSY